jgi:shikimate kinase/3-dehydroquinate synthase
VGIWPTGAADGELLQMVVVLVGFMGAGKTTVGRVVAEQLGLPFFDSDLYIEQQLGRSVRDIFATEGESHFRELEHRSITELVNGPDAVLALGGGAVTDARTRAALTTAQVVYLQVSYAEAMSRVNHDALRPMLQRADLDQVYDSRLPSYNDLAALVIDTDGRSAEAVAADILTELARLP